MLTQFLKRLIVLLLVAPAIAACATQNASSNHLITPTAPRGEVLLTLAVSAPTPSATPTLNAVQQTLTAVPTSTPTPDAAADLHGYCAVWSNARGFIWWVEEDGELLGEYQQAGFYPDLVGGEFDTESINITGRRLGDRYLLSLGGGWLGSKTWTGFQEGEAIIFHWTDSDTGEIKSKEFWPCTAAQYNTFIASMRHTRSDRSTATATAATATQDAITHATATQQAAEIHATATQQAARNATAAVVQITAAPTQTAQAIMHATAVVVGEQRRAVAAANDAVRDALAVLEEQIGIAEDAAAVYERVLRGFEADWELMVTRYDEMLARANQQPLTCSQLSSVQSALYTVQSARYSLESDGYSLESAFFSYNDEDRAVLRQAMQDVQTAYAKLENAVAANTTGLPEPEFSLSEVNEAISRAQTQLDRIAQVEAKADEYLEDSSQLLENAQAFVSSLTCIG